MDISATSRRRSLRLVSSTLAPAALPGSTPEWRRVAGAVLSCTRELGRHLMQQRWSLVDETLGERRELLILMKRMYLDADGRRCLLSLEQATHESELAVARMTGRAG
ncbi:MAG: hypothetical protein ABI769_01000 [Pseudomonadota bacterium]